MSLNVGEYGKAIVGGLVAGGTSLIAGLSDGSLTQAEIITAVVAAVVAFGSVFAVKNQDPDSRVKVSVEDVDPGSVDMNVADEPEDDAELAGRPVIADGAA